MSYTSSAEIENKFLSIKNSKFLNAQSRKDRLRINPFWFSYIYLWQKIQTFFVYGLSVKKPTVSVKTFWGESIKMVLPRPSFLYFFGFLGKSEVYLIDYCVRNLKEGDTFIDGGANIGFYSLLASNLVGSSGLVYSLEPASTIFPILQENVLQKPNIKPMQVALWKTSGTVSFDEKNLEENLYGSISNKSKELKSVSSISIDDLCLRHNINPTFIKLDTEGSELDILEGARRTIEKNSPKFVIEILRNSVEDGAWEKFDDFFKVFSYECFQLFGSYELKPIKSRSDIESGFYNFLFKKIT